MNRDLLWIIVGIGLLVLAWRARQPVAPVAARGGDGVHDQIYLPPSLLPTGDVYKGLQTQPIGPTFHAPLTIAPIEHGSLDPVDLDDAAVDGPWTVL